jgi:hypothetical protein
MQQLMNQIQQAKSNPQAFINQLSQQNPQIAQQINSLLQGGGNPQTIAMQMLQQRGINPNQLMQMMGSK